PTATVAEPTLGPTNADSLIFTVTFNEPVTGLDLQNFSIASNGVSGAAVSSVSATGDPGVYLVQVAAGAGEGTIQLVLSNSPTIADAAGNVATGLPVASGAIAVDTVAPRVSIDDSDADNL